MNKPLTLVHDAQQGKDIYMNPKLALRLATCYTSRFSIVSTNQNQTQKKEYSMPTLPKPTVTLDNGLHTLVAIEVKETKGQYGPQQEVRCLVEGTEEQFTRVWISHSSIKAIEAAEKCGLVVVDREHDNWEVVIGARFGAVFAGGKIVAMMPAAPIKIQQGLNGNS